MSQTTHSQNDSVENEDDFWNYHLQRNSGPVTKYLKQMLEKYPRDQEKGKPSTDNSCRRRVMAFLVRSRGFGDNDLSKMLELAEDHKALNEAHIRYVDKYTPELFHSKAAKCERVENEFLDKEVIPHLNRLIKQK